ncbi:type II secretion system F family protein [Thioalkalivibrio paradoxus]|uniref:Type II secretion system protein F n=1 Tax=Thioalkalivibrio paradoxus ARh 1 TaxID=713585 RepID=W0DJC8_9GAMM|nr:type II secretion system F family protein [Thioalkalivibrio paradoxus]AHE98556.1 type II secretion system protein F [Thioalkalivibrio paradoxus ARh 1]
MPDFHYRAARSDGSIETGTVTADAPESAARQLKQRGLTILAVDVGGGRADSGATRQSAGKRRRRRAIRPSDILHFTREMSVLLRAGLPLDRALKLSIRMSRHAGMVELMEDLLRSVKSGKGLSQALRPHASHFGEFYINMVRSGEAGGDLARVLERLMESLDRTRALREAVVSALVYPTILVVVALLSLGLMLAFVVPQFEAMFADVGEGLPWPTQVVLGMGELASQGWWVMVLLFIVTLLAGQAFARSERGQLRVHTWALRLPLAGELVRRFEVTRFATTLGTLLANGVALLEAMRIAAGTVGNRVLRDAVSESVPAIKQGSRVAPALGQTGVFPDLAVQMIQVGEESGRLDEMLHELSRVYDAEVQAGIKRSLTLLEPALIIILGALIAGIIVSILLGILSVNDLAL